MKKKIVLALITATMVGASLTGCGGKTVTDTTVTETTQSVEDTSNVDETSDKDATTDVETVEDSTDEDTTDSVESTSDETTADEEDTESDTEEIDESAILDTDVPENPEDAMEIILKIKDAKVRYEYFSKVNEVYFDYSTDEKTAIADRWLEAMNGHEKFILEGMDAVNSNN